MFPPVGVHVVSDRYEYDFEPLLERGGFVIDRAGSGPDPWQSSNPAQGLVRIRGRRLTQEGWGLTIELSEWWQPGHQGVHPWQGFSASAYEYYVALWDPTARLDLKVGFALDPLRHAHDLPFHWHPPGDPEDRRLSPIIEPDHLLRVADQLVFDARYHLGDVTTGRTTWGSCLDYLDYLP